MVASDPKVASDAKMVSDPKVTSDPKVASDTKVASDAAVSDWRVRALEDQWCARLKPLVTKGLTSNM